MATKIAELAVQSQIKKQFGSKGENVEIIPYSFGDFTKGKFKALTISIPQASSEDLAFSNFKAKTVCDFNHVIVEKKQVKFAQNFLMDFSTDITNDDLHKMMFSQEYLNQIGNIKLKIGNFSLLQVKQPTFEIKSGNVQISFGIETPLLFINSFDKIVVCGKLKAIDGKLQLVNMSINNTKYDISLLLPIINMINPLSFESKFADNMGIAQIKNVDIINDRISLSGMVFIPQNKIIKK